MRIDGADKPLVLALNIPGISSPAPAPAPDPEVEGPKGSFAQVFEKALGEVDALQKRAEAMSQAYATGQVQDLHQVMIALEEASLALQLTLQVRNKLLDGFQEIMRMQV